MARPALAALPPKLLVPLVVVVAGSRRLGPESQPFDRPAERTTPRNSQPLVHRLLAVTNIACRFTGVPARVAVKTIERTTSASAQEQPATVRSSSLE